MDLGRSKQVDEITQWIKDIFLGDLVAFDIKDTMLPFLQQLMETNEKENSNVMCILKEMERNINYYDQKGIGLDAILKNFGISNDTLSQDSKKNISCLSRAAQTLNIEEPSSARIILAITEVHNEVLETENFLEEEKKIMRKLGVMQQKQHSIITKLENFYSSLEEQSSEDDRDVKEKSKRTSFLRHKTEEYAGNIGRLKNDLVTTGLGSHLKHAQLSKSSEELITIKKELLEKKKELQAYKSIAPNACLAKIDLEEARRELEFLEAKLTSLIDFMNS